MQQQRLSSFPEAAFQHQHLETLRLDQNRLSILPDRIAELTHLKSLWLRKFHRCIEGFVVRGTVQKHASNMQHMDQLTDRVMTNQISDRVS